MSTKVFVGNLAFSTVAETLKEEFGAAGTVVDANIIARGPRSLGYGFVEMATPEEAEKAVDLINQKDIDGRRVNVEVARPREEKPEDDSNNEAGGSGGRRRPARRSAKRTNNNGEGSEGENNAGSRRPRRAYRPKNFQSLDGENGEDNQQEQEGEEGQGRRRFGNFGRRRFPARRNFRPRNNEEQGDQPAGQPKQFRPKRAPRPKQERVASSTTLFVANLPFAMDDDQLSELFADLKITKAHVVKKRNGRSKGFGFVEFANEEDQQAALTTIDGREVEGRTLNVKVALTAVPGSEETADEGSSSGAQTEQAQEGTDAEAPASEEQAPTEEPKTEGGDQ